ncbi:MAG: HAD family hydrolase [Ilumatobacteraceae bacterium]
MSTSDHADATAPDTTPAAPPAAPVPDGGPSAAFFDLDRTLISGSSAFALAIAAWRGKLVPTSQFAKDALEALRFRLSGASDDTSHGVRDRILGAVTGQRVDDLLTLNANIIPALLESVRPESKRLVEQHRIAGRATYIVSASPIELVEPLATSLGMTAGIGTRSEVVDGIYTGSLVGPFCYGPGKVDAITELARTEGLDLAQCYAYSDSASDLPMLEAVGHPVAVNPDPRLERVAAERGWPVVVVSQRPKAVVRRSSQVAAAAAMFGAGVAAGMRYARTHS